jgi:hypothetical protein
MGGNHGLRLMTPPPLLGTSRAARREEQGQGKRQLLYELSRSVDRLGAVRIIGA